MVAAYRQAPDITRQRLYIEMMNEVLPTVKQLYVVDESVKGILPLLNLTNPGEAR